MVLALTVLLSLSGCAVDEEALPDIAPSYAEDSTSEQETDEQGTTLVAVVVGDRTFEMRLYENETSEAFATLLPLTITMDDLHANEKFYYLEEGLPSNALPVSEINTGDLSLFGSDCLVLFYEDFATSFSYTPIGSIDNPTELAEAVGSHGVEVSFRAQ